MRSFSVKQAQPAFASVRSVTPLPTAAAVSPGETASADGWPGSAPCVRVAAGVALGPDGDAHAPIPNAPNTANKIRARLNTFDMTNLLFCSIDRCPSIGLPATNKESRAGSYSSGREA